MFQMSASVGELMFRAAAVYAFLFVALRFVGKKHIGELAPFDLVVLLILSETVQNAMIGGDESLAGGLIAAGTLIAIAQGMNWLSWYRKGAERWIDGVPKVLVRNGHCYRSVMDAEKVTISELTESMRREGCSSIADVRVAMLETNGRISILKRGAE
jgi:uncharacterized membrane protein YcaP (DUF421 family)